MVEMSATAKENESINAIALPEDDNLSSEKEAQVDLGQKDLSTVVRRSKSNEPGTLVGWGRNVNRELGIPTREPEEREPRIIEPFEAQGVVQVAAGERFSLVLDEFGNLHSFGVNNQGQLGRKTTSDGGPGLVGGDLTARRVVHVAAGHTAAAAVTEDGELFEWGLVHYCPPHEDSGASTIELHGLQPNRYHSERIIRLVKESTIRYLSSQSGVRPEEAEDGATVPASSASAGTTGASASSSIGDSDAEFERESRAFHAQKYEELNEEERAVEARHQAREKELAPAQQLAQKEGVVNLRSRRRVVAVPQLAESLKNIKVAKVSLGAAHVVALSIHGEILTKGYNDRGQLGTGHRFSRAEFGPVMGSLSTIRVSDVVCGSSHTLALTLSGEIWAFGVNTFGQLGLGATTVERLVPNRLERLAQNNVRVVQVTAGEYHSTCLTSTGEIYSWGHAEYGQHGGSNKEGRDLQYAHLMRHFYEPRPVQPFCSPATLALDADPEIDPTSLDTLVQVPVKFIASAARYSLAVDESGLVWSWGWNGSGVLGHGPGARYTQPRVIEAIAGMRVTHVTAGPNHVLVAVEQQGSQFALSYAPLLPVNEKSSDTVALPSVGHGLRADHENHFDIRIRSKLSATQAKESESDQERKYTVAAHRFVLFARCPKLRDSIESMPAGSPFAEEVHLSFVLAPLVLRALVEYLYTDHLRSCPPHRLIDLQQVAELLELEHLQGLCKLARHQRTLRMIVNEEGSVSSVGEPPVLPVSTFANDMRRAVVDTHDHNIFLGAVDPDEDDQETISSAGLASSANMDILCRYPFFEKLLTGQFRESRDAQDKEARIMLHNLTPRGLSTLLYWVYCGDRSICQPETVMSVLASARCFGVDDLARVCEAMIIENIDQESVNYIDEFAQDTNSPRLAHYCHRFRQMHQSSTPPAINE